MSWRATTWAAEQKTGKALTKLVLFKLADNANDAGIAWPSLDTIAADCELSRRAVQMHLARLESLGLIVIEERKTESGASLANRYRLAMTRGEGASHAPRSASGAREGESGCTPRVQLPAPPNEPPLEPSMNRHSLAPGGAVEGEGAQAMVKAEPTFADFRDTWNRGMPGGFPAKDEGAAETEWVRQSPDLVERDKLIAAVRLHCAAETRRHDARKGHDFRTKLPSNWLRELGWKGYLREVDAAAERDAKTAAALGRVRMALGPGVMEILVRRGMPEVVIAALDGVTFHEGPPAEFASVSGYQRTLLERHEPDLRRQFGDGLRIITGGKARDAG